MMLGWWITELLLSKASTLNDRTVSRTTIADHAILHWATKKKNTAVRKKETFLPTELSNIFLRLFLGNHSHAGDKCYTNTVHSARDGRLVQGAGYKMG
jgi:hypothetical protein